MRSVLPLFGNCQVRALPFISKEEFAGTHWIGGFVDFRDVFQKVS
jgi:hypothetical protein